MKKKIEVFFLLAAPDPKSKALMSNAFLYSFLRSREGWTHNHALCCSLVGSWAFGVAHRQPGERAACGQPRIPRGREGAFGKYSPRAELTHTWEYRQEHIRPPIGRSVAYLPA